MNPIEQEECVELMKQFRDELEPGSRDRRICNRIIGIIRSKEWIESELVGEMVEGY